MSDAPDPRRCPRCGSDLYTGGLTSAVRTCRECGTRYRPAASGVERGLVAAVLIVPSLLGVVIAVVGLALAIDAPPNDGGRVAAGLACFAFFGTASGAGLVFGLRELRGRPAVMLGGPDRPGRLVPADRAAAVVRALAEEHDAPHILKQLDGIRPDRAARARARFARAMTDDEVPLVLVDTSFLRNGRAGFLLTNRAVYSTRLPHPIALEDVDTLRHRPPDAQLGLVEGGMFLLHFLFPPAILLLLPLALRRRERKWHALVVNDRVVYTGPKNLVWDFWVDVLSALRAELSEPAGRPRVAVLEVFAVGRGPEPLRATDPPWAAIEQSLRALDGAALRAVRLWAGRPDESAGLEVAAGDGGYTVRELPGGPGGSAGPDVERVVEIARRFAATGSVE